MSYPSRSYVSSIQFLVNNSETNARESYIEVKESELFKHDAPIPTGVHSAYMGTTDHGVKCETCANKKERCPGHSGARKLKYPVLSPMFLQEIRKWLKVICENCGSLVFNPEIVEKHPNEKKLTELAKLSNKGVKCPECNHPHHSVKKDPYLVTGILVKRYDDNGKPKLVKGTDSVEESLYPHEIDTIFQRVTDETVTLLGKPLSSHPKNFVLNVIKIPANTIRPEVKKLGGGRSTNDDLTVLLQTIIKSDNAIGNLNLNNLSIEDKTAIRVLECSYYRLIKPIPKSSSTNNNTGKLSMICKSGTKIKSAMLRVGKKEGAIRNRIHGKRVHVIARSVITCGPYLKNDEIGVPMIIAKNIQYNEVVQDFNIERLRGIFLNGTQKYPGCTKIRKASTGRTYWIGTLRDDYTLEIGDTIMRDMIDGDVLLFNRFPSLLPSNISGNKAVIIRDESILTLQLNVTGCVLYNADFNCQSPTGDCPLGCVRHH